MRADVGVDRIMWGSDYPHVEGSHPYTREHLRRSFSSMDPDEIQQLVGLNAAALYGFDLDKLAPLAEEFGPTKEEIALPLADDAIPRAAMKCPAFDH